MLNVSLSAVEAFQRCEQYYYYGWVRKLRPLLDDVAPHRGTLIHEYLQHYYQSLRDGLSPDAAYGAGLSALDKHQTELALAASLYWQNGREEESAAYAGMLDSVADLARRYHNIHGRADADRYDVLAVEQWVRMPIVTGIQSVGRIDLLLHDRWHNRIWLVEHKSAGSIPEIGVRLWNLQTLLYATKLRRTEGIKVDGILWNYIRTRPPAVPTLLKSAKRPSLTRRADLDTNWETYEATLHQYGIDPREYPEVRERLIGREAEVYFPRYEHVIVADPDIVLSDFAVTSTRIRRARWEWEHERTRPVRTLTRGCTYCRYSRLCNAALTGGDEEDLIQRSFKVIENPETGNADTDVVVDRAQPSGEEQSP